jgi:hypothetical protein
VTDYRITATYAEIYNNATRDLLESTPETGRSRVVGLARAGQQCSEKKNVHILLLILLILVLLDLVSISFLFLWHLTSTRTCSQHARIRKNNPELFSAQAAHGGAGFVAGPSSQSDRAWVGNAHHCGNQSQRDVIAVPRRARSAPRAPRGLQKGSVRKKKKKKKSRG